MADHIKLTPGRVDKATCPAGKQQVILRDSGQPGLGLRVTAAGAKAYIFQGKLAGQVIRMTLGDLQTLTLSDARDRAGELRAMVRAGRDPRQVKAERTAADLAKRKKAQQDSAPALEAWGVYITARASKWSPRHKADHESMARAGGEKITRGRRKGMTATKEPGILRPLLELPLQAITRDRVTAWLGEESVKRPTRARLAVSLLSTFLTWCGDHTEYRDRVQPDACARVKKDLPSPGARDDCLQREQLKPWFETVRRIPNPVQSTYLQVALLTGARREEVAGLAWANVDFQWNSMVIHDKVEGERTIPLTPYVKTLLLGLKAINETPPKVRTIKGQEVPEGRAQDWKPSLWVFASATAASGRIQEPRLSHNKALEAAGLPHLTIHGLRRSFGTLAEWVECPAGIVAQIMGHKPSAIAEKHYRRRPLDLLRMWHTKIEAWILNEAGIERPGEKPEALKEVTAA